MPLLSLTNGIDDRAERRVWCTKESESLPAIAELAVAFPMASNDWCSLTKKRVEFDLGGIDIQHEERQMGATNAGQ